MKIRIAQLFVTKNISENLQKVLTVLNEAVTSEWILFPEGMISGYYPEDVEYTKKLDFEGIVAAVEVIKNKVSEKKIHVVIGSAYKESERWYNASLVIDEHGVKVYKKNNLSVLDRTHFSQGNDIPVTSENEVIFGVQMCRELVFPEQWRLLKQNGAQVIFHINNAIKEDDKKREALLIARAFENQCWVCSVNNAASSQTMRSMIVNPFGDVIWASEPTKEHTEVIDIDPAQAQSTYLEQARTDLVQVVAQRV